jgi:CDP-diacylglycerol--glycerol-3-phosphate 3-phosphatidyltransferase
VESMTFPKLPLATWITCSRLLGIPVILYGMGLGTAAGRWWSAGVFALAMLTDWVDGYVARRLGQVTELGMVLDPLVDKLLILAPLLCFVEKGLLPAWAVFLIVARELTITGWRVSQGRVLGANRWGKAKTVVQSLSILWLLSGVPGGMVSFWLALVLTLWSGWLYIRPSGLEPSP